MKRAVFHYSFLVPSFLFVVHQVIFFGFQVQIRFLDNYLDPFCFSAIVLSIYQLQRNWLLGEGDVSKEEVLGFVVVLSLLSEVLFPWLSARFTADFYDVLSIALGACWFWLTKKSTR